MENLHNGISCSSTNSHNLLLSVAFDRFHDDFYLFYLICTRSYSTNGDCTLNRNILLVGIGGYKALKRLSVGIGGYKALKRLSEHRKLDRELEQTRYTC